MCCPPCSLGRHISFDTRSGHAGYQNRAFNPDCDRLLFCGDGHRRMHPHPFFDPFLWPTPREWALFALSTCIGGIAYAAIVKATRAGDVAVIAPFRYSRLVFALFIAVFFFGGTP